MEGLTSNEVNPSPLVRRRFGPRELHRADSTFKKAPRSRPEPEKNLMLPLLPLD